jgi:hypothetical protein
LSYLTKRGTPKSIPHNSQNVPAAGLEQFHILEKANTISNWTLDVFFGMKKAPPVVRDLSQ